MAWHPALRLEIRREFSRLQRDYVLQRVLDMLEGRRWWMHPRAAAKVHGRPPINEDHRLRARLLARAERRWPGRKNFK